MTLALKRQKYPPKDVIFKIPTQSLSYIFWNSCYQSYCRYACSTQGHQEWWLCSGGSDCMPAPGSLTRPAQLSRCMSGRVARYSTVTGDRPEHRQTDRQTDLARIHTVSRHCRPVLLVITATSSPWLIFSWAVRVAEINCDQDREKWYSLSQSCCFLVLLYPPLGHSSIFAPLTCKKTSSK